MESLQITMNPAVQAILFYVFALGALLSALGVVALRNPVSCALSLASCLAFVAAVFFGAGATFLGIAQLIIYAGAILVLILFIVMMLNVKDEHPAAGNWLYCVLGVLAAGVLAGTLSSAALRLPGSTGGRCPVHVLLEHADDLCPVQGSAQAQQPQTTAPTEYGGMLPPISMRDGESDVSLLGKNLFTHYNLSIVVLSFALLAGAVGAVAVGRKLRRD